jgi:hypothetical protein
MGVGIITTKIPVASKTGFCSMAHEARTNYCILLGMMLNFTNPISELHREVRIGLMTFSFLAPE